MESGEANCRSCLDRYVPNPALLLPATVDHSLELDARIRHAQPAVRSDLSIGCVRHSPGMGNPAIALIQRYSEAKRRDEGNWLPTEGHSLD
jgi:hypothetical protein